MSGEVFRGSGKLFGTVSLFAVFCSQFFSRPGSFCSWPYVWFLRNWSRLEVCPVFYRIFQLRNFDIFDALWLLFAILRRIAVALAVEIFWSSVHLQRLHFECQTPNA